MPQRWTLTLLCAPVFVLTTSVTASAQNQPASAPSTETQDSTSYAAPVAISDAAKMPAFRELFTSLPGDVRRMSLRKNLFVVGLGSAAAVTSHAWDSPVARSGWGDSIGEAMEPGKLVGGFLFQAGGAMATYTIGRATGNAKVATIGARLFRAQVVAQGTAQVIKVATGRVRPDGTSLSFPSGHAAAAFATAGVLHAELGWKAGIPAYAMATWVAASRVQMERHYMSDVIAGATVGLLAARSVTIGRGQVRFAVSPMVTPGGAGISLVKVAR